MKDTSDRFGIPDSAFLAAQEPHETNAVLRLGMDVPTRNEVALGAPDWLLGVLIDWMWESPSELIPSNAQIEEVKNVLSARGDAATPEVRLILAACEEYLGAGGTDHNRQV